MADGQSTDWSADGDRWTRDFGGLDLSVWPDPDDRDEPWTYEVVLTEDDITEYEIAMGGAADLEAAKAAAEAAAAAWGIGEADTAEDD